MKKKSLLIFGAGLNQYQLIKAAKKLGVSSVVVDIFEDVYFQKRKY